MTKVNKNELYQQIPERYREPVYALNQKIMEGVECGEVYANIFRHDVAEAYGVDEDELQQWATWFATRCRVVGGYDDEKKSYKWFVTCCMESRVDPETGRDLQYPEGVAVRRAHSFKSLDSTLFREAVRKGGWKTAGRIYYTPVIMCKRDGYQTKKKAEAAAEETEQKILELDYYGRCRFAEQEIAGYHEWIQARRREQRYELEGASR